MVSDGDTFDLLPLRSRRRAEPIRIGLKGIDTRKKQPYGKAAKQYLGKLILGKAIRADGAKRPQWASHPYWCLVADTLDVNRAMVAAGYAWHFKKYSDDPALDSLERSARVVRAGLWAPTEPPIAPWDWRKGKRYNRN